MTQNKRTSKTVKSLLTTSCLKETISQWNRLEMNPENLTTFGPNFVKLPRVILSVVNENLNEIWMKLFFIFKPLLFSLTELKTNWTRRHRENFEKYDFKNRFHRWTQNSLKTSDFTWNVNTHLKTHGILFLIFKSNNLWLRLFQN